MRLTQYIRPYIIFFVILLIFSRLLNFITLFLLNKLAFDTDLALAMLFCMSWLMTTTLIYFIKQASLNDLDKMFKMIISCVYLFNLSQELMLLNLPLGDNQSLEFVFFIDVFTQIIYLCLACQLNTGQTLLCKLSFLSIFFIFLIHWKILDNGSSKLLVENICYPHLIFQISLCLVAGVIYHSLTTINEKQAIFVLMTIIICTTVNDLLIGFVYNEQLSSYTFMIESLRIFIPMMGVFVAGFKQPKKTG